MTGVSAALQNGLRVGKPVPLTFATPLVTQLCHLSSREGGFGNPSALSHLGSQASKKSHKPQRHRELTGWCVSTRVPVVCELGPARWPLAYPHPILEGLTVALLHEESLLHKGSQLHKRSQDEGKCWEWTVPA